ncbi:MAG TPA: transposase [Nitrososphaera sp.]|nr:transposase [Nitrososphaera sp.]
MLVRLNLDPLASQLAALYSPSPRGRPPLDPLAMLGALLLMHALAISSFDVFVALLKGSSRLAIIAGFLPHKTPSVGAFYAFLDRLEDGPFQPACSHRRKPSEIRKLQRRRNLHHEKLDKQARRQAILQQADSITQHLKDDLLDKHSLPRPRDLLQRLEDLLLKLALLPSAQRGLLGDLKALVLAGDGSALESGASCYGKPLCQCRKQGVFTCKCDRLFSDPSADWGWDSYRETYYFGHTFYQHLSSVKGHDLPLHVTIGPASESDFTLSLASLDRLQKAAVENGVDIKIEAIAYDAGHDAQGIYEYLQAKKIKPVIALNGRSGLPSPTGTAQLIDEHGVPLCPALLPMRRHSGNANGRIYYNCPVKRPTHRQGKTVWQSQVKDCPLGVLCQPDTKMGPVVYVQSRENLRLYPQLARDSESYKEIMRLRSGCERSNSLKKVKYKLGQRVCRNAPHYLMRLHLVSVLEHAKAWLAQDRKLYGEESQCLLEVACASFQEESPPMLEPVAVPSSQELVAP